MGRKGVGKLGRRLGGWGEGGRGEEEKVESL